MRISVGNRMALSMRHTASGAMQTENLFAQVLMNCCVSWRDICPMKHGRRIRSELILKISCPNWLIGKSLKHESPSSEICCFRGGCLMLLATWFCTRQKAICQENVPVVAALKRCRIIWMFRLSWFHGCGNTFCSRDSHRADSDNDHLG